MSCAGRPTTSQEQIDFVADIERDGFTYLTADGVYFDTSRQPDYGCMARLSLAGQEAGKRVDIADKRHPTDFALWKFSPPGGRRQMEWDSPWGGGRSRAGTSSARPWRGRTGPYFDIHCGGEDHITVHHPNEIAQTQAREGTRLANFWMHGYFLQIDDARMGKSVGEFLRVQSLIEHGYDPLVWR